MPESDELLNHLRQDFPKISFENSPRAHWSPEKSTVYYDENTANLFHELGHAILNHDDFRQDIELLRIERDAWTKASQLALNYESSISDDEIENAMDNYRDWLHQRSLCPKCAQTGLQSSATLNYYCINCDSKWKVNDARSCGLKRRIIQKTAPDGAAR